MSLIKKYIGKDVEIYVGDQYDSVSYADLEESRKSIIIGKIIFNDARWIEVEVDVMVDGRLKKTTLLVNKYSIVSILPSNPSSGISMQDMFHNESTHKSKLMKEYRKSNV